MWGVQRYIMQDVLTPSLKNIFMCNAIKVDVYKHTEHMDYSILEMHQCVCVCVCMCVFKGWITEYIISLYIYYTSNEANITT